MSTELVHDLPKEEEILALTHHHRLRLLTEMNKQGTPQDLDTQRVMAGLLKDMDAQALSRKRIQVEEAANKDNSAIVRGVAAVLAAAAKHKVFEADVVTNRPPPALGSDVPRPELVPGETSDVEVQPEAAARLAQEEEYSEE